MKIVFGMDNPGKMDCTLRITMSLADWQSLGKQLPGEYPSWKIASAITDLVIKAGESFYAKEEKG